jgi:hypothetical protein
MEGTGAAGADPLRGVTGVDLVCRLRTPMGVRIETRREPTMKTDSGGARDLLSPVEATRAVVGSTVQCRI